jgi:hypothetical protein
MTACAQENGHKSKIKKGGPLPDHLVRLNNNAILSQARSKRSRFITLLHAATKSFTNFS